MWDEARGKKTGSFSLGFGGECGGGGFEQSRRDHGASEGWGGANDAHVVRGGREERRERRLNAGERRS